MSSHPDAIAVRCDVAADTAAAAALLLGADQDAPRLRHWRLRRPDGTQVEGGDWDGLLAGGPASVLHLATDTGSLRVQPARTAAGAAPHWTGALRYDGGSQAAVAHAVAQGGRLIRRVAASGRLVAASLGRDGGTPRCLPFPPYAGQHHLIAVHETAWAAAYADAEAARAAWPTRARAGALHLLSRAEDCIDGDAFLAAVHDGQWAMARAARPGLTQYPPPEPSAADEAFLRRAPATLHATGHQAADGIVEFTCALLPDGHIAAWEIWRLRQLLADGRLDDGRRVAGIRVLFLDIASAERERRPLLDLGAIVQAYDAAGALVTIAP